MKLTRTPLIALAFLALASLAQAQVITTAEWEVFPPSPWSPFAGSLPEIDCTVPPSPGSTGTLGSGGCALRFTYGDGTYSTSFSGGRAQVDFPKTYDELWIGHWNRYSSGFVWNGNGTKMDFLVLADRGQFNFLGNMAVGWKGDPNAPNEVASNQIVWGPTTQDFAASYTAETNTWVWVEEHFRINTPGQADGLYEFYVNDVLSGSYSNVPYRDSSVTTGWGTFFHTAEWGGGGGTVPATQYWWVDHTVISTTRIGMPGGTTPPPPPDGGADIGVDGAVDGSGEGGDGSGTASASDGSGGSSVDGATKVAHLHGGCSYADRQASNSSLLFVALGILCRRRRRQQ